MTHRKQTIEKRLKDRLSELEDAYKERLIAKDEYESERAEILKISQGRSSYEAIT